MNSQRARRSLIKRLKEVQLRGNASPEDLGLLGRVGCEMEIMMNEIADLEDRLLREEVTYRL